jgi:predicted ester cyclase
MEGGEMADPEVVLRRLIDEGFSGGNLDVADELVADDLVEHQSFGPHHPSGSEGVKSVIASLRRAFSDFRLEVADLVVDGELVWSRNVGSGTNDGPFMGHPPTGRTIQIEVFDVVRVRDGKIVEHWGVPDRLGALFQLGLARPPAPAPA